MLTLMQLFIEHEYGIFGGDSGAYVMNFASNLDKPFILNTHTVLPEPEVNKKRFFPNLGQKSIAVICMTRRSAELMNKVYKVPLDKIYVIPHGVPIFKEGQRDELKEAYDIAHKASCDYVWFYRPWQRHRVGDKGNISSKRKTSGYSLSCCGRDTPKFKVEEWVKPTGIHLST
jgi:hypothetical protein